MVLLLHYVSALSSHLIQEFHLEHNLGIHAWRVRQPCDHNSSSIVVREIQTFTHLKKKETKLEILGGSFVYIVAKAKATLLPDGFIENAIKC